MESFLTNYLRNFRAGVNFSTNFCGMNLAGGGMRLTVLIIDVTLSKLKGLQYKLRGGRTHVLEETVISMRYMVQRDS